MFLVAQLANEETVKVPGPVKVWILQSPHSVIVPPVATIKASTPLGLSVTDS
jgi:hypothetical protein